MCVKSLQLCLTVCNPMDFGPPGHGILQAGTLEWVAMPSLLQGDLPNPGNEPDPGIKLLSLTSPALAGRFFTTSATGKPEEYHVYIQNINTCSILGRNNLL